MSHQTPEPAFLLAFDSRVHIHIFKLGIAETPNNALLLSSRTEKMARFVFPQTQKLHSVHVREDCPTVSRVCLIAPHHDFGGGSIPTTMPVLNSLPKGKVKWCILR